MQAKNRNYVEGTILGVKDDCSFSHTLSVLKNKKHNFKEKKF